MIENTGHVQELDTCRDGRCGWMVCNGDAGRGDTYAMVSQIGVPMLTRMSNTNATNRKKTLFGMDCCQL